MVKPTEDYEEELKNRPISEDLNISLASLRRFSADLDETPFRNWICFNVAAKVIDPGNKLTKSEAMYVLMWMSVRGRIDCRFIFSGRPGPSTPLPNELVKKSMADGCLVLDGRKYPDWERSTYFEWKIKD